MGSFEQGIIQRMMVSHDISPSALRAKEIERSERKNARKKGKKKTFGQM
jgi:hypothetical protein